jgi:DNA-binding LacI/PurR family transcriptional regulator
MTGKRRYASSVDVARLAGVSQSAVSRTYRKGTSVSDETRRKVHEAATALDYRPSMIPRIMLTHRSNLVGVVVGGLYNPFYANVLEIFASRLQEAGYQILLMHTDSGHSIDGIIPQLSSYRVDAIVSALAVLSTKSADALATLRVPVVLLNASVSNTWVSSVGSDSRAAGCAVADHLLERGARRFGFIAGPTNSSASEDRLEGFRGRLQEAGIGRVEVFEADFRYEGGRTAALAMFEGRRGPDAVFCANDLMAMGAMDALRTDLRMRVPEDVLVVGFDDIPPASWSAYDLTTVAQDASNLVKQSIDLLHTMMAHHDGVRGRSAVIPAKIVIRGSTDGRLAHRPDMIAQPGAE